MEVILMERVEKLGQIGDVVNVKPGFARNFLLPRGKALRATDANKQVFEAQRSHLEADNLKRKDEADAVATKMDGTKVILVRQAGEAGQLYGSVNARDVSIALTDAGFTVSRGQIDLGQPIKMVGLHDVTVTLHPEVSVTVTANVARTADEAEQQELTGHAALGQDDEDEYVKEAHYVEDGDADEAEAEDDADAETDVAEDAAPAEEEAED